MLTIVPSHFVTCCIHIGTSIASRRIPIGTFLTRTTDTGTDDSRDATAGATNPASIQPDEFVRSQQTDK